MLKLDLTKAFDDAVKTIKRKGTLNYNVDNRFGRGIVVWFSDESRCFIDTQKRVIYCSSPTSAPTVTLNCYCFS